MAWEQLLAVIEEAREYEAAERKKVPVECPNDYTALEQGPDGTLFCPWDGWTYTGTV